MVHIIADTTACLPPDFSQKHKIPVIPQVINFGTDSYYEGINIDNATFMERLRTSRELPKTAAPPPELFVQEFKKLVPTGEPIICIHPSSIVSGTVRSATVAQLEFPQADIRIIDTQTIGSPLGSIVNLAAQWRNEGMDADTLVARVEDLARRCRLYFLVDTLEYLARGGRIGGASALLGSVLQIKPILTFREGKVDTFERERTHKRALARLKEIVCEQSPHNGQSYLTVMHAGAPEAGEALARDLAAMVKQPVIPISDVPPAIVTHGGPGILGVGFFVK